MEIELRTLKLFSRIILDKHYNNQYFPYKNYCKHYKKVASRLWPMLFTPSNFFLNIHSPPLKENSPFWLTSLIFAEKFKFENPVIMGTSNVNKWSDSQQWQKKVIILKINIIQWYDPYQIKKGRTFSNIRKFAPVTGYLITFCFDWVHWLRKNWKDMKVWSATIILHQDGSRK